MWPCTLNSSSPVGAELGSRAHRTSTLSYWDRGHFHNRHETNTHTAGPSMWPPASAWIPLQCMANPVSSWHKAQLSLLHYKKNLILFFILRLTTRPLHLPASLAAIWDNVGQWEKYLDMLRWGLGKTLAFLITGITKDRVILSPVFSLNMVMISGAAVAVLWSWVNEGKSQRPEDYKADIQKAGPAPPASELLLCEKNKHFLV